VLGVFVCILHRAAIRECTREIVGVTIIFFSLVWTVAFLRAISTFLVVTVVDASPCSSKIITLIHIAVIVASDTVLGLHVVRRRGKEITFTRRCIRLMRRLQGQAPHGCPCLPRLERVQLASEQAVVEESDSSLDFLEVESRRLRCQRILRE
jgi:hypothetical protein